MEFKNLKIAIILGQSLEGCGVTRIATELQLWGDKNDVQADVFEYYNGKKYARRNAHVIRYSSFTPAEIPDLVTKLNDDYDIVFFMSYPHNKIEHSAIKAFYFELFSKLTKPIKAVYNLEIMKNNIDKIGYLGLIVNRADIVFHYGLDTWFSKTVDTLGMKKAGDRLHRFQLWMDFSELDDIKKKYPLENKEIGLVSVTRWSSLKNIGRTIDIQDAILTAQKDWYCKVHGVERSIGAKFYILDKTNVTYVNPSGKEDGEGAVKVYGPVERRKGLELMGKYLYSSSFFSLPKTPYDYGNRMEYSQIENAYLSIPVFDTHWGQNNKNKEGDNFYNIPYSAIYSNGNDIEEVANKLIELQKQPLELKKYDEVSTLLVKNEYDSNIVIPEALRLILKTGKQENTLSDYDFNKKIVNVQFADEIDKIEKSGEVPILGIDKYEKSEVCILDGHKKKLIKRIKKSKGAQIKNLF